MKRIKLGMLFAWVLTLLLVGAPLHAQEGGTADMEKSGEQAMAVAKRMAEFLSKAQSFSVTVDTGFDVVQDSGQKIEFGEIRNIVLRRPDHLRIDETKRNGVKGGMMFDGKDLVVFNLKANVYATDARTDKPGTVDEAIAHFINDLDMRLPLAELVDSNLPKMLEAGVREAAYVEQSQIAGVPCDHIALRGKKADLQLWVAQGDQPLPCRLVITYTREDGRPQYWAQFSDWNLSPKAPNSLFVFTPPKGAVKIAFSPRMIQPVGTGMKEGK
ncbi:DUF2092 domain-containing protein [Desulforhabdus amnigena]|uniref:DUF2092 domain-containing protein n=1 Tax=Desulforhabdus amnigena TaxID=40218 RepID=A0A9W6FU17_9BACT|nr:DUF2092 domain-containing protein [Desulforhabdus amnigena]NLJ27873.1 DUF2092 domain-containing protein [Deltaproteobacteria bacterium]GLI34862.1 hypothetical protein DAMNIGENAA_22950 [Desulforhabdus amnigena]